MTAFPMVAMCFERQWAGLPPEARRLAVKNGAHLYFRLDEPMQGVLEPLWMVQVSAGSWVALLSVKRG